MKTAKVMCMTRKIATVLVIVSMALCLVGLPVMVAAAGQEGETLTVGVPADRCPVFYQDANTGEIVGIGVDLMRAACEEAGYAPAFQVIEESTLKDALDNQAYDVVMPFGSAVPSTSGQKTIVTENLIQTPFTLVTEGDRELPPLNQLRVGMLSSLGAGAETVRQLYPGIEITLYETMPECVKALRDGEVDALLHNSYVWSFVLQKPAYSDLHVQPDAMFSMDFRAGTLDKAAGREVVRRLNRAITAIPDTKRQAITLDYTSRRLYRYDFSDYLHQYGVILALTLLLVVALVVIAMQKVRAVRLEQEEKLRQLIDHDPLTGVLSMNGFRKRVKELLNDHPDIPYLLSYVNFRHFKYINDSLGMEAGDELLQYFTSRTQEVLTEEEAVGRIEGDHFAVLRRAGGEAQMLQDEKEVMDTVRRYFTDRGKANRVQVCSGIYVLGSADYQKIDVDHMIDFARVAERRLRDDREEGYEFYNPDQWEKGKRVTGVINHLPEAIRAGELQVWYQPQVNYKTGRITGAEALCRWPHSEFGFLYPTEFIPVLEEAGLIYEVDCFVWERVCQDLQRWNLQGRHLSISVNLSRADIREGRDIPGQLKELIKTYGLTSDQLRVEITESAFVEDPELLIRTTDALREAGIYVEMDDFGTGYSSLHMLKEVTVDRIKLDLHFLSEKGDTEKGRIIVSHIIRMLDSLEVELIAEGVETIQQARFLLDQGCTQMQGYYFYKPMEVDSFESKFEALERFNVVIPSEVSHPAGL